MTSDGWISDQKMVHDAGVAEAGGQGGRMPTQILTEWKAPMGSGGAPRYYLFTQIFRPCAISEL